jgi:hypothetical protein
MRGILAVMSIADLEGFSGFPGQYRHVDFPS